MFLDFDNDGWPDLLLVNGHVYPEVDKQNLGSSYEEPRILYRNNGNNTFTDISSQAGPGITARSRRARTGYRRSVERRPHFSRDQQYECRPSLLVNQIRSAESLDCVSDCGNEVQPRRNRRPGHAEGRPESLVDEVRSGSSYDSNSDMRVHFGLGAAAKIDWVQVRWPRADRAL